MGIHTIAMFLVIGLLTIVVYEKQAWQCLRRAQFNLARLLAGALILSGALVLLL